MITRAFLSILLCAAVISSGCRAVEPDSPAPAPSTAVSAAPAADAPSLFIVGDSTVKNKLPKAGWGDYVAPYFDTERIHVHNRAIGGRSSRSFIEEGRWQRVLEEMKPGDFVMVQMGHNDSSLNRPQRYSLKGIGEETVDANDPKTGEPVRIHTYGWYLRRYAVDAREKGATLIFVTPVLRNSWDVEGANKNDFAAYAGWMRQIAQEEKVPLLDLNRILMKRYGELGKEKVSSGFFDEGDNTHTNLAGAEETAACAIAGLRKLNDCNIGKYLRE